MATRVAIVHQKPSQLTSSYSNSQPRRAALAVPLMQQWHAVLSEKQFQVNARLATLTVRAWSSARVNSYSYDVGATEAAAAGNFGRGRQAHMPIMAPCKKCRLRLGK